MLMALLLFALPAVGQSTQESDEPAAEAAVEEEEAVEAAEAQAAPPVDLEAIAMLELGTYETTWARYKNGPMEALLLDIEGVTQFPFRTVSLPYWVKLPQLGDLDFVSAMIADFDLHYDEDMLQGVCDTERLRKYGTTDVLCGPGSSVMEPGLIVSVLYHPQTFAIAALTTTLDNIDSYATRADEWRNQQPAASADDEQAASSDTCGPWNNGRWLTADEYHNSGVSLPVNTDNLLGAATHYECRVPENGQPFMIAWTVMEGPPASNQSGGGDSGGSGGSGSGGGGDGGDGGCHPGHPNYQEPYEPGQDGWCY